MQLNYARDFSLSAVELLTRHLKFWSFNKYIYTFQTNIFFGGKEIINISYIISWKP